MDKAFKVDLCGKQEAVTASEMARLCTRSMSFLCFFCYQRVRLHRYGRSAEFFHARANKNCPYPRHKRAEKVLPRPCGRAAF
jgi:hypothetical protein